MAERRHLDLRCPNRCDVRRFEALNAPVFVDGAGAPVAHEWARATYVCATCGSVAVDVAAAAREMSRRGVVPAVTLTCPACRTVMLPPEDDPNPVVVECPACATQFAIEEGLPRLHGGGGPDWDDDAEDGGDADDD